MANRRLIGGVLGGESLLRPSLTDDLENILYWAYIDRVEIARLTAGVPPEIFARLGLNDFLALDFAPPNIPAVIEFVEKYDAERHRSIVEGREVELSLENIRNALRLPVGTTMCPRLKQKQHLADWFDFYDGRKKVYWSNTCLKPGWAPIFELINAILLCRRYSKEMGVIVAGEPVPVQPGVANVVPEEEDPSNRISEGDTEDLEEGDSASTGGWNTSDFETLDGGLARRTLENTVSTGRAQADEAGPFSPYRGLRADARPLVVERRGQEPATGYTDANSPRTTLWMETIRNISAARPEATEELEPTEGGTELCKEEDDEDDGDDATTPIMSPDVPVMAIDRDPGNRVVSPRQGSPGAGSLEPGDREAAEVLTQLSEEPALEPEASRRNNRTETITETTGTREDTGKKRVDEGADENLDPVVNTTGAQAGQHHTSSSPRRAHEAGSLGTRTPEAGPSKALEPDASRRTETGIDRGKKPVYEGMDENLDIGVDLDAQAGQHHTNSSPRRTHEAGSPDNRTPEAGPSVAPGRDYAEAERRYRERLSEIEADFKERWNQIVMPWAQQLLWAVHICELDMHSAWRQTRMIHKERLIEFARYGSAAFALRAIPIPDLERIILENRAEQHLKELWIYPPLPCDNFEHEHDVCEHGCSKVACHFCRVCAPAALTAQSERDVYKRAGFDQKGEPLFSGWGFGVHHAQQLPDPMDRLYRPTVWMPPSDLEGAPPVVDAEGDHRDGTSGNDAPVDVENTPRDDRLDGEEKVTPEDQKSERTEPLSPQDYDQRSDGTEKVSSDEEMSNETEKLTSEEQRSGGTEKLTPDEQRSGGTEKMTRGDEKSVGSKTPDTVTLTPDNMKNEAHPVAVGAPSTSTITPTGEASSLSREPVETRLTPLQKEIGKGLEVLMRYRKFGNITPMKVPETHYSHRINLANYDIEGKSDEQIRITVAELLTEVEREVRQAGSVYFRILMKAFAGSADAVPHWNDACEWVMNKYVDLQKHCKNLTNTEQHLVRDLEALQPAVDALDYLRGRHKATVKKTLVLDLNGLLVKIAKDVENMHHVRFMGYKVEKPKDKRICYVVRQGAFLFLVQCLKQFNIIVWSSRRSDNLDAVIKDLETKNLIPFKLKEHSKAIWAQEQCEAYHTYREDHRGGVLYAKPLDKMYDLNLSTRSALLVDDSVEKNSTNHPYQAVHPPSFDLFSVKRPTDTFLLRTLYPWLEKFAKWKGDTISFVQAHGREIQTVDLWDSLTQYWSAPLSKDLNFMFSSLPRRQQKQLLNEYHAKLAESIRQTELDVKAALEAQKEIIRKEHEEALKQTALQETEGTSASRRPLIPQPKDLVNIVDKTELLLAAVRDEEMEEMGGE
ncbi:hypothetical protein R1sor_001696 [Riccia sorocarpa]|uniref:FCP1 homology domain-containing protein n=1 Tax=Riccia sorocarpa TaxID=122646 RepID=A0ABD3H2K9_9MARC